MNKFSYEIKTPKGTFQVDSDKELTDAQAFAYATGGTTAAPPPPPPEDPNKYAPATDVEVLGMRLPENVGKFAIGAGAAVARAGRGLGHLLPAWKDDPRLAEADENAALYERNHPGGIATAGEIAGDVAMSVLPLGAVNKVVQGARGVRALPMALDALAKGKYVPAAADIAANAGYAAATSPEDRATAAEYGAAGSAAGRALSRALGGLVKPGPRAQALFDENVVPTVGQTMGEGGAFGRSVRGLENAASTLPIVGAPVRYAQDRAMKQWQTATRDATGVSGAKSIADVGRALGNEYDDLFRSLDKSLPTVSMGEVPLDQVNKIRIDHNLTDRQFDELVNTVVNTINSHTVGESMTAMRPSTANEIGKRLLKLSQRYKTAPDPRQADFGHALEDMAYVWRDHTAERLGNPAKLVELNDAWKKYAPLREVAKTGDLANPSEYTPKVLLQAIRKGDKSANKSGFIEGGDLPQQQLAKAGQVVLGEGARTTEGNLLGTAGLGALLYLKGLAAAGIGIPAAALYSTEAAQRFLQGNSKLLGGFQRIMQERPDLLSAPGQAVNTADLRSQQR